MNMVMVKNIDKIAAGLSAKVIGQVPDTGSGAFGAARLAKIVETMQARQRSERQAIAAQEQQAAIERLPGETGRS